MFEKARHPAVLWAPGREGSAQEPVREPSRNPHFAAMIAGMADGCSCPRCARASIDGDRCAASMPGAERSEQQTADPTRPDTAAARPPPNGEPRARTRAWRHALGLDEGGHPCTDHGAHCTCRRYRTVRRDVPRSVSGPIVSARYRQLPEHDAPAARRPVRATSSHLLPVRRTAGVVHGGSGRGESCHRGSTAVRRSRRG